MGTWEAAPKEKEVNGPQGKTQFSFVVDGCEVIAEGTRFTGMETIYVNGKLSSKKRTFSKDSRHEIEIEGNSYTVAFKVPSVFGSKVLCSLINGDKVLAAQKCEFKTNVSLFFSLVIIISFLFGALGFIKVKLGLPDSIDIYVYLLQAITIIVTTMYVLSNSKAEITEENA